MACSVTDPVGCVVQKVTDDSTTNFAQAMMAGYDSALKNFATSWLGKGMMVDLSGPSVDWFKMSTSVVTLFLVTLGLMFAGIKTLRDRNGRPVREVFEALGRVVFVSAAGSLAVQVFVVGGDAYGQWILKNAGLDTGSFVVSMEVVGRAPGLAIILGLFGILTVLCQWGLMFVRGALLPLLAGYWPIAASAAMLEGGKKSFEGVTEWLIAFVVYSPIAASIYALAWRLKNGDEGLGGVVNGWILIVLAVLTLPALMRLIAPVSSAMGRMAGGVMATGITAAAVGAGVAVGAAVVTGGASAGASGGAATTGGKAAGDGLGAASGGAPAGGEGLAGGNGSDGASGKHAAGSASSDSGGPVGGGAAPGGGGTTEGASDTSSGGGSGTPAAVGASASSNGGGNRGAALVFEAAKGALDTMDGNHGGTAEGMVAE